MQEVRANSKKLVMVLICAPPSCSASVRQSRAATAAMRAARLTRHQAAGNRFSAGQAPVAAAIDVKHAENMFGIAPSRVRRVSAGDVTMLLADIVFIALMDGDLDEEVIGLGLRADSAWFDAPRVVLRDRKSCR